MLQAIIMVEVVEILVVAKSFQSLSLGLSGGGAGQTTCQDGSGVTEFSCNKECKHRPLFLLVEV